MKRKHGPSFADLLAEPTWSEVVRPTTWRTAGRRGRFNDAGEFFDPEGRLLQLVCDHLEVALVVDEVRGGARIAVEGCGCRTYCAPVWWDEVRLTRFRRSGRAPTIGRSGATIELWSNEAGSVVFVVGELRWIDR